MKAERRHELKTNTLARGLENLPEVSRQHGTKILAGVLVVLLAVFVIRQRIVSGRERSAMAAYSLNSARGAIAQLDEAVDMGFTSPQGLATLRQRVATAGEESIRSVLETADDPRLLAEAKLARGDLNWRLANFPDLPGAATQPTLQFPRSKKDLLSTAEQAYQDVFNDPSSPVETVRTARFGLAAVHENRGEWDKAKEQYQKLVNDIDTPGPFKDQAVARLNAMETLRKPVLFGPPATAPSPATATSPSTGPSTSPSTTQATTGPASKPAPAPAPLSPNVPPSQQPKR